ncbi:MAG: 1-acyl-sn-glycerol-3-phosphate acyltransferase [Alphaproteobacteria bacterium]|nr:1-acyl-sn-glycerol-3-phosphate acyltransferase [Alphaproteobacteria bacterium]
MTLIRSLLFNPLLWLWTAVMVFGCSPLLLGPGRWSMAAQNVWAAGTAALIRHVLGIRCEVRGRENLPEGPMIVASKHQSAYETVVFHQLLHDPGIVLKKELLAIPLYGWFSRRMGMIPIDRGGSARAMRVMLRAAEKVLAQGRPILIFPEGTRSTPGQPPRYHAGVAGLYRHLGVPVVPVALNSGLLWGRRALVKRPGTVVFQYLPPIQPGLDRHAFMAELELRIETATAALLAEAGFHAVDKPVDELRG